MTELEPIDKDFYKGLQALSDASFPKKCSTCGKIYKNVNEYLSLTQSIGQSTGLKESQDEDDTPLVELFRNCMCGSTLMDVFNNRRDLSAAGIRRRQKFEELLNRLSKSGFTVQTAREELLKIMRGESSALLQVKPVKK